MVHGKPKQVIVMDEKQQRVFNETRLRNLKRTYAKLTQHADLTDSALALQKEIQILENQLQ